METHEFVIDPKAPVIKIGWKEKYAGILVFIIGIIYLILQVSDFLSSKSNAYSIKEGAVNISTTELLTHIRSILTILLAIIGGLLLIAGKKAGWVIGLPILLLVSIITAGILYSSFPTLAKISKIIGISALVIELLAVLFLLLPSAQKKYRVGKLTYLPTLIILAVLSALYFFLQ